MCTLGAQDKSYRVFVPASGVTGVGGGLLNTSSLCAPPPPRRCYLCQAVQAAQLTFEDFFMADLAMAPLKIVGFEGVFGSIMMFGVLLPIAYYLPGPEGYGLHENSLDTLAMIKSSKGLQVTRARGAAGVRAHYY